MKKRILLVLAVVALAMIWVSGREVSAQGMGESGAPAPAAEAGQPQPGVVAVLMSEREKVSYSIGIDIGTNLKMQSVDVDVDMLARGIEDAVTGAKPLLTQEEMQAVMLAFQEEHARKMEAQVKELALKNLQAGEAFLAENKEKVGVVTTESGLQYIIITEGDGPKPTAEDMVMVNYRGMLIDGSQFDSSYDRGQPQALSVGQVIAGMSEALQMMPVGSKWRIFIPAALGYGERGAGPVIAPNSTLIFEVELLSIGAGEAAQ